MGGVGCALILSQCKQVSTFYLTSQAAGSVLYSKVFIKSVAEHALHPADLQRVQYFVHCLTKELLFRRKEKIWPLSPLEPPIECNKF
jgi:hypothetical protein